MKFFLEVTMNNVRGLLWAILAIASLCSVGTSQAYQVQYTYIAQPNDTPGCSGPNSVQQGEGIHYYYVVTSPSCSNQTITGSPSTASFDYMSVRLNPVWMGSYYDCAFDVGDYAAMAMVAPGPAVSQSVSGAYSGWDILHCDPNTLSTSFPSPSTGWLPSYCNATPWVEQGDIFNLTLNLNSSLIGTQWIVQWARYTEGYTFLSSSWQLDIS